MRYKMKQRAMAMGSDFDILNHQDESVFFVDGEALS